MYTRASASTSRMRSCPPQDQSDKLAKSVRKDNRYDPEHHKVQGERYSKHESERGNTAMQWVDLQSHAGHQTRCWPQVLRLRAESHSFWYGGG